MHFHICADELQALLAVVPYLQDAIWVIWRKASEWRFFHPSNCSEHTHDHH